MYKSKYSGIKVDELLDFVSDIKNNPANILQNISGADILAKMSSQEIIDKINSVDGNIEFKKYVDCQAGAGKTT